MNSVVTALCNICGNDVVQTIYDLKINMKNKISYFSVVECGKCGLLFIHPLPGAKEVIESYPEDYYAWKNESESKLKKLLKRIIFEECGNYPQPRSIFMVKMLRKVIAFLGRSSVSITIPFQEKQRILDVGCGSGHMLEWLSLYNYELCGVDISDYAIKCAKKKGFNVQCGELKDVHYPSAYFDIIVLNHVIEHVRDPFGLIKEIRRILKPHATVIIGIPNIESYDHRVFGSDWSGLQIPMHIYHFSASSMRFLLERAGFINDKIIGKYLFIPNMSRNSLNSYRKHHDFFEILICIIRIYFWKYFRLLFIKDKYRQAEFLTFYARRSSEVRG